MKAEILIAWADNTWTTEVHDVPDTPDALTWIVAWAETNLTGPKYKDAVVFAPFCVPVDADDPEACPSYEAGKAAYDRFPGLSPFPSKASFTCSVCRAIRGCPWAWDLYNTNGDCLANK